MDKKYFKKIIAQTPEDLQIISACCSESKVNTSEIKYLPSNKIFLLSLLRFDKENENNSKLINSIIKFEFIESSKSKNIDESIEGFLNSNASESSSILIIGGPLTNEDKIYYEHLLNKYKNNNNVSFIGPVLQFCDVSFIAPDSWEKL